jgi:hypothetical protein
MSRSTYKSLRRREAAVQKQLKRTAALWLRLSDQLQTIRENICQTETGARLHREMILQLIFLSEKSNSGPTTESDSDA